VAAHDGQRRGAPAGLDPDQNIGFGRSDRGDEVAGGEVAVGQHEHARPQAAQQLRSVGGLPAGDRAEDRVDEGAGAAGHQRQQPGLGVAGAAMMPAPLGERRQVRRAVRHGHDSPVDRAHQQPAPPRPAFARDRCRAAEQVKQEPQRRRPDPAACLCQRAGRGCGHRQARQGRGELAPHTRIPSLREQAGSQQQIHHHP
jgi:hypothetical protein